MNVKMIVNEIINSIDSFDGSSLWEYEVMLYVESKKENPLEDTRDIGGLRQRFWISYYFDWAFNLVKHIDTNNGTKDLRLEFLIELGRAYVNPDYRYEFSRYGLRLAEMSQEYEDEGLDFDDFPVALSYKDFLERGITPNEKKAGGRVRIDDTVVSLYQTLEPSDTLYAYTGTEFEPQIKVKHNYNTRKAVSYYCTQMNRSFGTMLASYEPFVREVEAEAQRLYSLFSSNYKFSHFKIEKPCGKLIDAKKAK